MSVDPDLMFVIGMAVGLLALPASLAAWTHGDSPRKAAILCMIAIGLVSIAVIRKPEGYSLAEAPQVVIGVVEKALN